MKQFITVEDQYTYLHKQQFQIAASSAFYKYETGAERGQTRDRTRV